MRSEIDTRSICIIFCVCFINVFTISKADDDHLRPINLSRDRVYRRLVSHKLCETSFDCGRVLTVPAFSAERCISVYSKRISQRAAYFISCARPTESLWQRTDGGNHPQRAQGFRINRIEAEIPDETAARIKKVWQLMLMDVRPETLPSLNDVRTISTDATILEFSLQQPSERVLYGKLNVSLSLPGKKTKALVELSDILGRYCEADIADRPRISARIDARVRQLLAELQEH